MTNDEYIYCEYCGQYGKDCSCPIDNYALDTIDISDDEQWREYANITTNVQSD